MPTAPAADPRPPARFDASCMSPAYAAANPPAGNGRGGGSAGPARLKEAASAAAGAHTRAAHSDSANSLWAHMAARTRAWPPDTRAPLRLRPPHSTDACGAPKRAPVPSSMSYSTAEPRGHAARAAASASAGSRPPQAGSTSARPYRAPSISTSIAVGSAVAAPRCAAPAGAPRSCHGMPASRSAAIFSRWPRMNSASGTAPRPAAAAGASSADTPTARAGPPAPPGPCTAVTLSGAETCAAGYEYSYEARRVALRPPNIADSTRPSSAMPPTAGAAPPAPPPQAGGPGGSCASRSLATPAPPITAVCAPPRLATETGAPSAPRGPAAVPARPPADRSDIVELAEGSGAGAPPGPGSTYETDALARLTLLRLPGWTSEAAPPPPPSPSEPSYRSARACILSSVVWPGPARAVYANAAEYHGRYGTTRTCTSWTEAAPRTGRPMLSISTVYVAVWTPTCPAPGRNTSSRSPCEDSTAVSEICAPPSPATAVHAGAAAHVCVNSSGSGAGPRETRNESVSCRAAPNWTCGRTWTDGRSHS